MTMNWHPYITSYETARKLPDFDVFDARRRNSKEWYETAIKSLRGKPDRTLSPMSPTSWLVQAKAEYNWIGLGRPFFNVWPVISEGLLRTRLDIPSTALTPIMQKIPAELNIRFAVGHEPIIDGHKLRTALTARVVLQNQPGLMVLADAGQRLEDTPVYWEITFPALKYPTFEDAVQAMRGPLGDAERNLMLATVRIIVGAAMLADDPDIVDSVVLKADADKYAKTGDAKYVDKAARRGVVGWNVGARVEVSPHFRRAHFAIRWTGKGGAIPLLRPVKSSIVKKQILTEVPTGYEGGSE